MPTRGSRQLCLLGVARRLSSLSSAALRRGRGDGLKPTAPFLTAIRSPYGLAGQIRIPNRGSWSGSGSPQFVTSGFPTVGTETRCRNIRWPVGKRAFLRARVSPLGDSSPTRRPLQAPVPATAVGTSWRVRRNARPFHVKLGRGALASVARRWKAQVLSRPHSLPARSYRTAPQSLWLVGSGRVDCLLHKGGADPSARPVAAGVGPPS